MSAASGLEPINLQIPRRRRVIPASFFVLFAAALWIAGLASSDGLRVSLLNAAVIFTAYTVIMVITWMVAGDEGRWLRLDDEGMTLAGDRIPWEAVITARWAWNPFLNGRPGVELRLRRVDGYEPPRSGKVAIDPTLFGISGKVLLDLIVRYARPHTVYVLAPRHPPDLAIL
jgi:hypothetical protein